MLQLMTRTMARAAAPRAVTVREGAKRVRLHPLGGEGSYVRKVEVLGASRREVLDALPGPATGPNGFAPRMLSSTPVERQFDPRTRTTRADHTRIAPLPEALGATVAAAPTADGLALRMSGGLTSGRATIRVGPERRLADGTPAVEVTEAGSFTLLAERPASLLALPAWLATNWTPFGRMLQAGAGAAVCDAHVALFELADVLRRRLARRTPG